MAAPPPRVGPSPVSVLLLLLGAAVIGFLGGALLALSGPGAPQPTAAATPAAPATTPAAPAGPLGPGPTLTLTADRQQASTDELIRLEGRLTPAQGGVSLQLQQAVDEGEFVDFPVTATTRADGSYGVWVRTGREGRNQFRAVTTVDGEVVDSPPVVVVVG